MPDLRGRISKHPAMAGGAAVAALAVVTSVTVAVNSGGPDTVADAGGPIAAARTADREPRGPSVRNVPFDCGLTPAVITRLTSYGKKEVTDSDGVRCTWSGSGTDPEGFGSTGAELEVKIQPGESGHPGEPGETTAATGDAVRKLD